MTALIDSIGFGIILPVLPNLIGQITGEPISVTVLYSGWLMFVFAVMQFLFAPIIGNLSDSFGRRPILLGSLFVIGINYLLMGLAESLTLLFIGRIICGIGSATRSTCNAYIADISPTDQRAQNFGLMGAAFGLGFVIGPVLGGILGEFGPRIPFFAAALLSFANMLFGTLVLKESLQRKSRRVFDIKRANPISAIIELRTAPIITGLLLVIFILNIGQHALPTIWSFWGIVQFGWSPAEIGYSLGFIGICMVLVQGFLIRWIIPRTGLRIAGWLGIGCTLLAFIGYATASQTWMVYLAMIPGALGGLAGPAMQGIAANHIAANQQGKLQGSLASIMALAAIISPFLMTQTFSTFTQPNASLYFPGAAFLLSASLTLLALIIYLRVTDNIPKPVVAQKKRPVPIT
ncbi:MAG: TCR/Tet family MFS transporter [Pseudomonadales bacterium]|nr:TCR/Tet family MFS transporter [Pseudomonadales bacterium]